MLQSLSIRDFVIVDELELEFSAGFTVLSGETGAGKSILVDALALVLGERGDAGVVREGRPRADLAATFTTDKAAEAWLIDNDMADDGHALLRRVVDASGRSKAWINGAAATLAQLRELGDRLVDIHGQHAHQLLLRGGAQRELLDAQGGHQAQATAVAAAFRTWRDLKTQLARYESDSAALEREREQLAWQVDDLTRLAVRPGEWDAIGDEHRRLANAAALIEGAQAALLALSEADDAIASRLSQVAHRLDQLAAIDPLVQPVLAALEPARIEIDEAVHGLNAYLSRVELDPARLAEVDARMEAIHSASRKFRLAPDALVDALAEMQGRLATLQRASDVDALRAQEAEAAAAYDTAARALSTRRKKAATAMAKAVTDAMQTLSMAGGRFEIACVAHEPGAHGLEDIEYRVAAHAGSTPRALAKVASGGELARISLAISVIASVATTVPTLIFDEVDSGIGGAVAEVVGRLLRRLGDDRQVLCVTHLPQVAALGHAHFAVRKDASGGAALTRIDRLDDRARIDEIARMLGGIEITTTTRRHAREMLAVA